MKLFLATLLVAILVALAMAADEPQKAIIVSYPDGAPESEMDELRKAIDKVVRSDYADIVMGLGSPYRKREASSPTSTISLVSCRSESHMLRNANTACSMF